MISAENSKQKSIAPPTHSWHAARLLNTIFGGEGELGVVITTVLLTGKQVPNLPVSILCVLSPVQLFVAPWTVAHQAPLLMEFSRQEYWSGVPLPPLGDLPDAGIEPAPLASPSLAGGFFTASAPLPGRGCPLTREGKPPYQGGCCCSSVTKSCLTLCDSMELQHTRLPCPSLSPGVCSNSYPLCQ